MNLWLVTVRLTLSYFEVNNKAGFVDIDIKIHVEGALEIQIIHFQVFCDTNKVLFGAVPSKMHLANWESSVIF